MEGYEDQERQRPGERELDGTVENYRERNGRQGTKAKKITYQHEKTHPKNTIAFVVSVYTVGVNTDVISSTFRVRKTSKFFLFMTH